MLSAGGNILSTVMNNLKIDGEEINRFYVHVNLIECVSIERTEEEPNDVAHELTTILDRSLLFNTMYVYQTKYEIQNRLSLSDQRHDDVTDRLALSIKIK